MKPLEIDLGDDCVVRCNEVSGLLLLDVKDETNAALVVLTREEAEPFYAWLLAWRAEHPDQKPTKGKPCS
jgi:hypothetical protein